MANAEQGEQSTVPVSSQPSQPLAPGSVQQNIEELSGTAIGNLTVAGDVHVGGSSNKKPLFRRDTFSRKTITSAIARRLRTKTGLIVLFVLLSSPILSWQGPILIASFFSIRGLAAYQNMDIAPAKRRSQALNNYKQGLRFNPKSQEIHYNLGLLYEDWNKWDEAAQAYEVAMQKGRIQAYNNLARLYIRQGKANEAIGFLESTQESDNYETFIPEDLYNFHKNLGWARWQQGYYQEAEEALSEALIIADRIKEVKKEIGNPKLVKERVPNLASADCILAHVLHDQEKQAEARRHWQRCLDLGNSQVPEEDEWMGVARQRLNPDRID